MKHMFPLRKELRSGIRRHTETYHVKKTNKERFKKSNIPYICKTYFSEKTCNGNMLNMLQSHEYSMPNLDQKDY